MKAIIELNRRGSVFDIAAKQVEASERGVSTDYHLIFDSAKTLFSDITPARFDLLATLRSAGPVSIYGLSKIAGRNDSNVHTDVNRLIELGLIERGEKTTVSVPFDAVEIRAPLVLAD